MLTKSTFLFLVNLSTWNIWCASARDLPDYFPKCRRLDPNFEKCLIKATETMKPFLNKGIPEFKIAPVQPFLVPEVILEQGSEALNFKAILTNINVDGLTNYTFHQFDADFDKLVIHIKGTWDDVKLRGDYDIQGRILVVPIKGNGQFTASFSRGHVEYIPQVSVIEKNGKQYYKFGHSRLGLTVENPKLKLDGQLEGGEEFSRAAQKAIDENIDLMFDDMKPVFEKILSNLFEVTLFNKFANHVPIDSLFGPAV